MGRLTLSYREAVDLLVSLAIAEQLRAPWLIANLAPIRRKFAASFSPALRDRIDGLRARILVGFSASAAVVECFTAPDDRCVEPLFHAFLETRRLAMAMPISQGASRAAWSSRGPSC